MEQNRKIPAPSEEKKEKKEDKKEASKKLNKQQRKNEKKRELEFEVLQTLFPDIEKSELRKKFIECGSVGLKTVAALSSDNSSITKYKEFLTQKKAEKKNDSHKDSSEDETDSKKPRMTTSEEIFNRIQWDPKYNEEDFIIGYEDRFVGLQEIPLSAWQRDVTEETFIPWHRVQYFKQKDKIVWDKRSRLDIFGKEDEENPKP